MRGFSRKNERSLEDFIGVLQRIECLTVNALNEEAISEKLLKSIAVPIQEQQRKYKQEGGFLSSNKKLRFCPKCAHGFCDEPPANKNKTKKNANSTAAWKKLSKAIEDFDLGI